MRWMAWFLAEYLSSAQKSGYREKVNVRERMVAVNISGETETQRDMSGKTWCYGCLCSGLNQTEGFGIPPEHMEAQSPTYFLPSGNSIFLSPFKMCSPFQEWRSWPRTLPGAPSLHKSPWSHHKLLCHQANTCNTWPKYKMRNHFTSKKNKTLKICYCTYYVTPYFPKMTTNACDLS